MYDIQPTGLICALVCAGGCTGGCLVCVLNGPVVIADAASGGTSLTSISAGASVA